MPGLRHQHPVLRTAPGYIYSRHPERRIRIDATVICSFGNEQIQGEHVCRQCRQSTQRHSVMPVSSSPFPASLPLYLHLRSLEPRCTRSSLPENTYFLLGGGGWNVRLDSRAGISTPQKIQYSAIFFVCFVCRIQAGRTIISSRLLLYAYWKVQSSSCNIIPYPARLPLSLHEAAVTISPKLVSIPEMGWSVSIPRKEGTRFLLISRLVTRRGRTTLIYGIRSAPTWLGRCSHCGIRSIVPLVLMLQ